MQQSEEIVQKWIERVWNDGELEELDHFHPPSFRNEGRLSTPDEAKRWHEQLRSTFPDIRYEIEELF